MELKILDILEKSSLLNDPSFPYWLYDVKFVHVSEKSFIKAFIFNKEFDNKLINSITFSYNNQEYTITEFNTISQFNNKNILGVAFEIDQIEQNSQLKILKEVVNNIEYCQSQLNTDYEKAKFPKENDYLISKNDNYRAHHEVFPVITSKYWQCSCGRIHSLDNKGCYCGLNKNKIEEIINFNYIDNHIQDYLKTPIYYNLDKTFEENVELYKARFFENYNIDSSLLLKYIDLEIEEEKYNRLIQERNEEIKATKDRNRKIFKVSSIIITIVIIAIVCIKFIVPEIRYYIADSEFKKGNYDAAITKFENLNYKDSYNRSLEVSYAKANNCVESENFDEALQIFEELKDYSDSKDKYYETIAMKAEYHCSLNNYKEGYEILFSNKNNANLIPNYNEILNKCAYNYGKELYNNNNFEESVNVLSTVYSKYLDVADVLRQSRVKYSEELYNNKDYKKAYKQIFLIGVNYSDEMHLDIIYNYALENMNKEKQYQAAVSKFQDIISYKDSKEKLNECKYLYITTHKHSNDTITYQYLKDLKSIGYKDSSSIFESLYKLSVELVSANTNPDDYSTKSTYIDKDCSYFHMSMKLNGGEPHKTYTLSHNVIYPDGDIYYGTWKWEDVYGGNQFSIEWPDGLFTGRGQVGTLRLDIYNNSKYIDSVYISLY